MHVLFAALVVLGTTSSTVASSLPPSRKDVTAGQAGHEHRRPVRSLGSYHLQHQRRASRPHAHSPPLHARKNVDEEEQQDKRSIKRRGCDDDDEALRPAASSLSYSDARPAGSSKRPSYFREGTKASLSGPAAGSHKGQLTYYTPGLGASSLQHTPRWAVLGK